MGRKKGLGVMVKQLREAKGLTQAELAEKAEISREYVALMESGVRANPTIGTLKRLAKVLGVPVGDLVE
ncbi:MAG: helix-turn-helix transcriptional regulator [Candidatus Methylomirabilota bacterium]|jgi:transcriptional regulator with XRE-family HTH domain